MSAYGKIIRSNNKDGYPLESTLWTVKPSTSEPSQSTSSLPDATAHPQSSPYISIHHLTLSPALSLLGLVEYLHECFAQVVEDGTTYPQEGDLTRDAFESYFFAADVLVAVTESTPRVAGDDRQSLEVTDGQAYGAGIEEARNGRQWSDCIAGFYYVKPNYPGRSSHICNAGFVVPPKHRGRNYGAALARSYVYYAPKLGYKASVFNLVYVNNIASIRLWERLGFIKAGLIPRAGRLRRPDGNGEHYVDAHVFYKSFIEESGWEPIDNLQKDV